MKPHTYPTGRFNTVALVADVCIFNRSSPGVMHFQEKRSIVSTPFEILEDSCLVPRLRKKKIQKTEQNKKPQNKTTKARHNCVGITAKL